MTDRLGEFELWWGHDAEEFERLISYPKIGKLCERKRGLLRYQRAQIKAQKQHGAVKEAHHAVPG